jgi:hypothetical protein
MPKHDKIREDELVVIMGLKGKLPPSQIARMLNRSKYTIRKIVYKKEPKKQDSKVFNIDHYYSSTLAL